MIALDAIRKTYRDESGAEQIVLDGASLRIPAGQFAAITGPSGCGKTTLLNLLGGLDLDFSGELVIDGQPLKKLSDRDLSAFRNRTVGFVFQQFNLLQPFTALENVLLPGYFAGDTPRGRAAPRDRALAALDRVGLADKAGRRPAALSGGERQRVAIARALFTDPKIVLCDEPTGNLDAVTGGEIIDLFVKLVAERALTLVVVTHEARVSAAAQRVLRLQDRALVEVAAA